MNSSGISRDFETKGPVEMQRRSPYQGLIPYDERDQEFFFGREKEIRIIAANLFSAPLTLLYGASGVGKSSVLRAGVVPRLRQDSNSVVIPFNAWQGDAVNRLNVAVRAACPDVTVSPSASLAEYLITCATGLDRQLIVLLDQFEEYFLYHPQDIGDDSFALQFSRAVTQPDVPLSFLISIREDSLAKLDRFEGHIPFLFDNYLRLEHLDRRAATAAIIKPVEQYNRLLAEPTNQFTIEPALVQKVIEEVKTGQIVIGQAGRGKVFPQSSVEETVGENIQVEAPYLQLVLTRLWDEEIKLKSSVLRLATLTALGGADKIIRTHLDEVMKRLKPDQQEVAAHVLHYLVTPSGTKIALSTEALAEFTGIPPARVQNVVERLSQFDLRILRQVAAEGPETTETWYEIFHDALAPAVLEWRVRYFSRKTPLERLTRSAIYAAGLALLIQTLPQLSNYSVLLLMLRGFSLLVLHTAAVSQVYQWFYRQVRPKVTMLPLAGLGGRNMGILLGLLLPILWLASTKWPDNQNLGTIMSQQFILYLFTLVVTVTVALITFFVIVQGAGSLTDRLYKRFDVGFYGAYFGTCLLIIVLILLTWAGIIPKWISL
jgi:hypothetical protein